MTPCSTWNIFACNIFQSSAIRISMPNIIAIANQKGGVGKTTSTVNLGAELAKAGSPTLIIDFDPQGSATSGLGVELIENGNDLFDMFFDDISLSDIIKKTNTENLYVAPASKDLVSIEIELGKTPGRELILKSEISILSKSFDYILIDCPPSSGLLTLNALGAANYVAIPLQAEYYALEGLSALMDTIKFVQSTFNPSLDILGVFLTMYDNRTNLSAQVWEEAAAFFKDKTFNTKIPRNVRLSECPSHGLPICDYAPDSSGAKAYHDLAKEIATRCMEEVDVPRGTSEFKKCGT